MLHPLLYAYISLIVCLILNEFNMYMGKSEGTGTRMEQEVNTGVRHSPPARISERC